MKKGKELKIETYKHYNITYGSVNSRNPKALFFNLSAWAQLKTDVNVNYLRVIKDLHKKVKQTLFDFLSSKTETEFVHNRSIVDLDMRESGVKYGKRSFVNCEITLFLKENTILNTDTIKEMLDDIAEVITSNVFNTNRYFKFHRKKL